MAASCASGQDRSKVFRTQQLDSDICKRCPIAKGWVVPVGQGDRGLSFSCLGASMLVGAWCVLRTQVDLRTARTRPLAAGRSPETKSSSLN